MTRAQTPTAALPAGRCREQSRDLTAALAFALRAGTRVPLARDVVHCRIGLPIASPSSRVYP